MNAKPTVLAAGAVVWRQVEDGIDVVLVHRPRYADWSFPKGKVDPGEHALTAAVREVAEETGLTVRLGPPLRRQEYVANGVPKRVHYWAARRTGDTEVDGFLPTPEVDRVAWVPLDDARRRLTYRRDIDVLDAFAAGAHRSHPLIVLRHAHAQARDSWHGEDRERPLSAEGETQAQAMRPLLRAYGVRRVVSSEAVRCIRTVEPYAGETGIDVETDGMLCEEGASGGALTRRMRVLLGDETPSVVCSHRPVLPNLFEALGVSDPRLRAGAFLVVHHEAAAVRAVEHHRS